MAKISAPLTITAVLVLLGCGSTTAELPVRTEYSKTTQFHEWKTFRFSSEPTGGGDVTRYPKYEKMSSPPGATRASRMEPQISVSHSISGFAATRHRR